MHSQYTQSVAIVDVSLLITRQVNAHYYFDITRNPSREILTVADNKVAELKRLQIRTVALPLCMTPCVVWRGSPDRADMMNDGTLSKTNLVLTVTDDRRFVGVRGSEHCLL